MSPAEPVQITLTLSHEDASRLWRSACNWAGNFEDQAHRFETTDDQPPGWRWRWRHAYWMGHEYANVVLLRAYLESLGHPCEVVTDLADGQWVILTGWES